MTSVDLEVVDGTTVGGWISGRLSKKFGTVGSVVPKGYEAYARVLHAAFRRDGTSVRWSEAAGLVGKPMQSLIQWEAIAASEGLGQKAEGVSDLHPPEKGNPDPKTFITLCELMGSTPASESQCYVGIWVGWDWGQTMSVPGEIGETSVKKMHSMGEYVRSTPNGTERSLLKLGPPLGREYLVMRGPLALAAGVKESGGKSGFAPTYPNLVWPEDCQWCWNSDIDLDSTIVGGPRRKIEALCGSLELEALPVDIGDALNGVSNSE